MSQKYKFEDEHKSGRIMVTGGTYEGRLGWRRLGKPSSATRNWVILDDAGNVEDESLQVSIKKDSTKDIVAENVTPINREQAVFKEFPDILVSLDEFLGKLVEVHDMEPMIDDSDTTD